MATTNLTPLTSSNAGSTNVSGLASGIQWNDLIDAMIKSDGASTQLLQDRSDQFKARQDSVRSMNTRLLSLQLDLNALRGATQFNVRSATSSSTALTVSANSSATAGSYVVDVVTMAKANQLATAGQASSSTLYGADTIHLRLGTGATTDIAIDANNSSLDGIARSINGANLGVTATVVNDGTTGSPYRLMLASTGTGTANAISITADSGMAPLFTGMTTLQAATNAKIRLGGTNGLEISQSSNTFSNVINGLSFTVNQEGVNGVGVNVGTDASGVKTAVKQVVSSLNAVAKFMADNATYDSTNNKAGVLFSETDVRNGYNSLVNSVLSGVQGLPANLSTLDSIGMTFDQKSGQFSLDESAFDAQIAANPSGVLKLFANSGTSTDAGIQFGSMTGKTAANKAFAVEITQAAKKAVVQSTGPVAGSVTIDGTNRDLSLEVNGRSYSVQLSAGTYTPQTLATHLQSVLDQKITTNGDKVTVGLSGGNLSLSSSGYGITATIKVDPASTANAVLNLGIAKAFGVDVAGKIDGQLVQGDGQVLSGVTGSDSEGLKLLVTAGGPVASASVTAVQGLAQSISQTISRMTDNTTGSLTYKDQSLQASITALTKSVADNNARLLIRRQRYQQMFQNMEKLIQQSNSTGSYLTGQIKGWQNSNNG